LSNHTKVMVNLYRPDFNLFSGQQATLMFQERPSRNRRPNFN
jgi:hypothetical protein